MKFHKIIRESLALHLADKSAVCAINRHLRFSQECANAPLSTMNVKKSFTLVQVYSSPFYAPTWGADSSRRAQCIGHCGAAPRSEEHTSELQSHSDLVFRLLL